MIDNFELIKPMFYFNEANYMFFHCQIVQRAKDHPEKKVKEKAIKTYFVRSKEHLEDLREEIILLCEYYGARAYINVAGKDFDALQKLMLFKLASDIQQGIVRNPRKCLNSAAGELKSRRKEWLIDIDQLENKKPVIEYLDYEFWKESVPSPYDSSDSYLFGVIPTVQCCHLLVRPFNLEKFRQKFPDIDVHKNSMGTLLYYPKSLEK